jgi:hypothetical protein
MFGRGECSGNGGGALKRPRMTPQEHNKFVGLAHVAYAGFHVLMMIASMAFVGFMFENVYSRSQEMGGPPPPAFLRVILIFAVIFNISTTIPSIVAGYALLKRRSWAKVAGIVAGGVAAMSFPVGTAVAVYTFWFLFSDPGKQLYGVENRELPPLPPEEWRSHTSQSAYDGRPTSGAPPDWR